MIRAAHIVSIARVLHGDLLAPFLRWQVRDAANENHKPRKEPA